MDEILTLRNFRLFGHIAKLGILLAFNVIPGASPKLTGSGLSIILNDISYYVAPLPVEHVTSNISALSLIDNIYGFAPVTIVQESTSTADLDTLLQHWSTVDDVFQDGFTGAVLLGANSHSYHITRASDSTTTSRVSFTNATAPSGPYFIEKSTGALHRVYRLYDDFAGSFTTPLLQTTQGTFQPLSAQIATSATMTIGVPSRLYFTKTADKPLAGVRIGVKDIYQLAGVRSSYGNRAWYNLYPENNLTATVIQRLIDAGAQVVGLQKPSQFANGETATADWVDYHSPFNPRGDGYEDPSSSSSGAGASIASYEWLDVAVGSDTGGSIRGPSQVQGLFGNRPSHALVELDHVMPLSTYLDTAGMITRDPYIWDVAQQVMYGDNYTSFVNNSLPPAYPTTIYTVEFPDNASASDADAILINFARKLADLTGGNLTVLDLSEAWSASSGTAASDVSLSQFLNLTYPTFISKEQTSLVRDPFYADYAAIHDNRFPAVDPGPLIRWDFGDNQPENALDSAIYNKTTFMDWFNTEILVPVNDTSQCSSGLLIYPGSIGMGSQSARNVYRAAPTVPFGFSSGRISSFAECPDSVFPIGQASGFSYITQHDEYFPITVDVLAAKGCDGLLVRLAQDLVQAGIIPMPEVGRTIHGGDILMKP